MAFGFEGKGLIVDKPVKVYITDPNEDGNVPLITKIDDKEYRAYVEVYSADSKHATAWQQELEDKVRDNPGINRPNVQERNKYSAEYLAHMTTGWCLLSPEGDLLDVPFSQEAALVLYNSNEWIWFRNQVALAVASRRNFIRGRKIA